MGLRSTGSIRIIRRETGPGMAVPDAVSAKVVSGNPLSRHLEKLGYDNLLRVLPTSKASLREDDIYGLLGKSFRHLAPDAVQGNSLTGVGTAKVSSYAFRLDLRENERGALRDDKFDLQIMKLSDKKPDGSTYIDYVQVLFTRYRPGANRYELFRGRFYADGTRHISTDKEMGNLMVRRFLGQLEALEQGL